MNSTSQTSPKIIELAPKILEIIKQSKSVLLHCHPSPDPDSVASALAMKFAVESLGIKATVIAGDSKIPREFGHFPGADQILKLNFFEIDLSQFDLFLIQDTASLDRISMKGKIEFPANLKTINIDHHPTNPSFAEINLIVSNYPATSQILAELFEIWKIKITPEIARNLFVGIYTDTGGFKYRGTSARTFEIVGKLVEVDPNVNEIVSILDSSNTPEKLIFQGLALSSIETFYDQHLAISAVPFEILNAGKIPNEEASAGMISGLLRTVIGWDISVGMIEIAPNEIKVSFRSRDQDRYDVSKITGALGGGGHKAAAGVFLKMNLGQAKELIISKVKEIYNL